MNIQYYMYIPNVHTLFWGGPLHVNGKTLHNGIRSSSLPEEDDEDIRETKTTLQVGTGCGVHTVKTYNMYICIEMFFFLRCSFLQMFIFFGMFILYIQSCFWYVHSFWDVHFGLDVHFHIFFWRCSFYMFYDMYVLCVHIICTWENMLIISDVHWFWDVHFGADVHFVRCSFFLICSFFWICTYNMSISEIRVVVGTTRALSREK